MQIHTNLEIDDETKRLLEWAKEHPPSEEELQEQRISFAYGNLALHNPNVTKDDIRRAAASIRLLPDR